MIRLVSKTQLGFGLAAIVGGVTAVTAPQFVGASLAFGGGLLAGGALATRKVFAEEAQKDVSSRVSGAFTALYERNGGLVDAVELAFVSNTPVQGAHAFLTNLAENTGGEKVSLPGGTGAAFNFPHANNSLQALSQNAQAWAETRTQALQKELNDHKSQMRLAALQRAARVAQEEANAPVPASVPAPQNPAQQQVPQVANPWQS